LQRAREESARRNKRELLKVENADTNQPEIGVKNNLC